MFVRLGNFVSRYWALVILFWVVVLVALRPPQALIDLVQRAGWKVSWGAPAWDDVTYDGDFAYLPASRPSVIGERLMTQAFPDNDRRSQFVLVVARIEGTASQVDLYAAYNVAFRVHTWCGAAEFAHARQYAEQARQLRQDGKIDEARAVERKFKLSLESAVESLDKAVSMGEELRDFLRAQERSRAAAESPADEPSNSADEASTSAGTGDAAPSTNDEIRLRLAQAYYNRAALREFRASLPASNEGNDTSNDAPGPAGGTDDSLNNARFDRERAAALSPDLAKLDDDAHQVNLYCLRAIGPDVAALIGESEGAAALPLVDAWTWRKEIVGEKLIAKRRTDGRDEVDARLIMAHLSSEFMAAQNMPLLNILESEIESVRRWVEQQGEEGEGLELGISGSAAIGADMLWSAVKTIRSTDLTAVVLVVVILLVVYRSPMMVAVPLCTIFVSLVVAMALVAMLTQMGVLPGFSWWDFKIFKTTKIFIVVIMYGAGTDYCLFLISRYREELAAGADRAAAVSKSLGAVGDALAASALTTIFGLGTMFFAEFGKFRNSGPAIALCLVVALLACLTLAPAMLRAFGPLLFWPFGRKLQTAPQPAGQMPKRRDDSNRTGSFWTWTARKVVAHPGAILIACVLILLPLAGYGVRSADHVTFDFLSALDPNLSSPQGTQLLRKFFPVGESGPVVVMAQKEGAHFLDPETGSVSFDERDAILDLTRKLYDIEGVESVRSSASPLGKRPSARRSRDLTLIAQQNASLTKRMYITHVPELEYSVTRLEVVLAHDPFSVESAAVLKEIDEMLLHENEDTESFWHDARFAYTGTTPAITDLRAVTKTDTLRIEVLVVLAVMGVLLLILKRPLVCAYMIVSVLFTYYVTIGATDLFFGWAYGSNYVGMDWKTPLFLFVILVAVGADYNVYLATRVFEEQQHHGPFTGLRRAVARTGGIITSCGVIMAGTFISMTSGTWPHLVPSWVPMPASILEASRGVLRGIVELGFALALGVVLDTFIVRPILLPAFLALLYRWKLRRRGLGSPSKPSRSSGKPARKSANPPAPHTSTISSSSGNGSPSADDKERKPGARVG